MEFEMIYLNWTFIDNSNMISVFVSINK